MFFTLERLSRYSIVLINRILKKTTPIDHQEGRIPLSGKEPEAPLPWSTGLIMTSNTSAAEYLQLGHRFGPRGDVMIVNGGHYMTRGHVILCLLYIKMHRNVKKYFGAGK
jgi:hypothetical protein